MAELERVQRSAGLALLCTLVVTEQEIVSCWGDFHLDTRNRIGWWVMCLKDGIASGHGGDCTNDSGNCILCHVTDSVQEAEDLLVALVEYNNLDPVDRELHIIYLCRVLLATQPKARFRNHNEYMEYSKDDLTRKYMELYPDWTIQERIEDYEKMAVTPDISELVKFTEKCLAVDIADLNSWWENRKANPIY